MGRWLDRLSVGLLVIWLLAVAGLNVKAQVAPDDSALGRVATFWSFFRSYGLLNVSTNASLKTFSTANYAQALRWGYTAKGDVTPLHYRASTSACSSADNGAQVASADGKCWLAQFIGPDRTVDQWGADPTGTNDSRAAIMAAISASYSTATCNVLWFTGAYKITGTAGLVEGNGSSSAESTLGCTPVLSGTSNPVGVANLFGNTHQPTAPRIFSSSVTDNLITVKGPLYGWGVQNLILDCGNVSAAEGLNVISAQNGDSKNLAIVNCFRGLHSHTVSAIPSGMNNADALHNKYENIVFSQPDQTNTIAIYFAGDGSGSPTSNTDFNYMNNLTIWCGVTIGHNCYAFYLEVSDSNIFHDVHILGGVAGSVFINFQYATANSFPSANFFYGIDCGSSSVTWSNGGAPGGSATANKIYGLLGANSCAVPAITNLTVN